METILLKKNFNQKNLANKFYNVKVSKEWVLCFLLSEKFLHSAKRPRYEFSIRCLNLQNMLA